MRSWFLVVSCALLMAACGGRSGCAGGPKNAAAGHMVHVPFPSKDWRNAEEAGMRVPPGMVGLVNVTNGALLLVTLYRSNEGTPAQMAERAAKEMAAQGITCDGPALVAPDGSSASVTATVKDGKVKAKMMFHVLKATPDVSVRIIGGWKTAFDETMSKDADAVAAGVTVDSGR